MGSANERRCYHVRSSLIGWAHTHIILYILSVHPVNTEAADDPGWKDPGHQQLWYRPCYSRIFHLQHPEDGISANVSKEIGKWKVTKSNEILYGEDILVTPAEKNNKNSKNNWHLFLHIVTWWLVWLREQGNHWHMQWFVNCFDYQPLPDKKIMNCVTRKMQMSL